MTPLLQVSQWEDHAKLTANEFVCAGDYLISNDPTWKWAATMMKGDNNTYEVDYLPSSKQYIYNEDKQLHTRLRREAEKTKEPIYFLRKNDN